MSKASLRRHRLGAAHELPEALPDDEHVLWQGAPGWWPMARSLHIRPVAVYFALALAWLVADRLVRAPSDLGPALLRGGALAAAGLALFAVYALLVSRTTSYTLTNKRLVLQAGIALPISYNIPYGRITAASLRRNADGSGNIAVAVQQGAKLGFFILWPHVHAGRRAGVEPMLRAVPHIDRVSRLLTRMLAETASAPAEAELRRVLPPETVAAPAASPGLGHVTAAA